MELGEAARGMERSFEVEIGRLTLGAGATFHGEGILAITKALLQSGVAYVGGYPGAPVSHLMDVLADSRDRILAPLGVQFEASASEAGAAALLGASIHYPLRGAVTWKSIVGTNVASDALSNLAAAGVTGGALIVVGEDYGEGASVIQERTHAVALKSGLPLIDPRYHMPKLVDLVEKGFELSEASNLPVVLSLRIRAAHMTGSFVAKDNKRPPFSPLNPLPEAKADFSKIVLPPSIYLQEKDKLERRLPAARKFIRDHGLNEHFPGERARFGIILQGGTYGVVQRGLRMLDCADAFGATPVPLLVLNVIHPLVPEEIVEFCRGKDHVLVVEEGNPAFIEQQVKAQLQDLEIACRIHGKDFLPEAGEYVADTVRDGLAKFLAVADPAGAGFAAQRRVGEIARAVAEAKAAAPAPMPARPPGFCTGCPERPIFTAFKLLERERGPIHVSADIGCNTFATLPPFNMGSTVLGYGLSLASAGAVGPALGNPSVAIMGDGGFWHGGLTTGAVKARWNDQDSVLVILENGYASATGQQHVPSTGSTPWGKRLKVSIENVLRGIGVTWIERVYSYDLSRTMKSLRRAFAARKEGLRVVISDAECMLARQRRDKKAKQAREKAGKLVEWARFGVDADVCVGDHACMRLSGCPSLTLAPPKDIVKDGPTAFIDASCVGCGLCGEVVHTAGLCPSFYRAERVVNPTPVRKFWRAFNDRLMAAMGAS